MPAHHAAATGPAPRRNDGPRKPTALTPARVGTLPRVETRRPVSASQSFTVRSWLAVANHLPSGEKATAVIAFVWPFNVNSALPLCRSQTVASPGRDGSPPAEARRFPSGE